MYLLLVVALALSADPVSVDPPSHAAKDKDRSVWVPGNPVFQPDTSANDMALLCNLMVRQVQLNARAARVEGWVYRFGGELMVDEFEAVMDELARIEHAVGQAVMVADNQLLFQKHVQQLWVEQQTLDRCEFMLDLLVEIRSQSVLDYETGW